jgi:hypothetical protein
VAHKDKGRKGDKDKGKKRDRTKNEAALGTVAAQAAPKVEAVHETKPSAARPRATTPRVAQRPVATRRGATPTAAAHKVERPALPTDRASLLALHQAARRERDAAPRLSRERAEASFEIERIEVQIARVERALDPPLV